MFRTKDLVISVVPKTSDIAELQRCLLGTHICLRPTVLCARLISCGHHSICPQLYSPCGFLSPCGVYSLCGHLSPCGFYSCGILSPCGHLSPCPLHSVACEFGTRPGCPGVSIYEGDPRTPIINPAVRVINEVADIKALRQELDEVQKKLAEFEQKGLDVEVETPEDLAELESKLKEALDEVQAKRKASGGGAKK